MKLRHLPLFLLAGGLWAALSQCALPPAPGGPAPSPAHGIGGRADPGRRYAGEVLSHMMRVVIGDAGPTEMRPFWKNRGLDVPLDLGRIERVLDGEGSDKAALMVFDPNILGLSEVLYHYDSNLNQFRGRRIFNSIYPSPELIALRLLLVQKRQRGEKIRIQPLLERAGLLSRPAAPVTRGDLRATNLTLPEMRLLRDVVVKDPPFLFYLRHPALIGALHEAGLVENDAVVARALRARAVPPPGCRRIPAGPASAVVRILLLPSLIAEFEPAAGGEVLPPCGFRPTAEYRLAVERFVADLLKAAGTRVRAAAAGGGGSGPPEEDPRWQAWWRRTAAERIAVAQEDRRPLAVTPANADETVAALCPEADFTVVILGKNVYRSIRFDGEADGHPAANRIYLDFLDLKFAQTAEPVDRIGRFIVEKLLEAGLSGPRGRDRRAPSGRRARRGEPSA